MEQIIVYPLLYIPGGDGRISEPINSRTYVWTIHLPLKNPPPKKCYTSLGNNIANSFGDYFEVESLIFVMQNFQYACFGQANLLFQLSPGCNKSTAIKL